MTAAVFFGTNVPALLVDYPDDAQRINCRFQIDVTGVGGGSWNLLPQAEPPSCTPGTGDADCTITMTEEVFERMTTIRAFEDAMRGEEIVVTGWRLSARVLWRYLCGAW